MKQTFFCGKKSLLVNSSSNIDEIKNNIKQIGSFNISSKYYSFLSKKNVNNLKENSFLVSLRSFGKSFVLFITKINEKKYCIFINKKNESMNIVQLAFVDEIYNGTIFDGEIIKNDKEKWIFLINDIAYYKGSNLITENFNKRLSIIDNILKNEFKNNNDNLFIAQKQFFSYNKILDLVNNFQQSLNYKNSGLYFKNLTNFSDNYLFIFPECRTDSKILNNGVTIDNQKVVIENDIVKTNNNHNNHNNHNNKSENSNTKIDISNIKNDNILNNSINSNNDKINMNDLDELFNKDTEYIGDNISTSNKQKLDKQTCNFLVNPTNLPDVYELYCYTTNNLIEKYSYASVPNIETSVFLKNSLNFENVEDDIMRKINNNNVIYFECKYHKIFKKWIPMNKTNTMDNINTINKIQIILDSL